MTTIKDVGRRAQVSIASVSKVLNGDYSSVSEETKERILAAAKELKYRPNRFAQGLVKNQTTIIGLIIPDISNPYFAELAKGVEAEAEKNGFNLILCNSGDSKSKILRNIQMMTEYNANGIILHGSKGNEAKGLELLLETEVPFVAIDCTFSDDIAPVSFYSNNKLGAIMGTEQLIISGHKKIAFIGGDTGVGKDHPRFVGYKVALMSNNITYDENMVRHGTYTIATGYEKTKELLNQGKDFTAVVCANDLIAFGVIKAVRECGMDVPRDISLVGYDDIILSSMFEPMLTTIKQDSMELGKEAFKELHRVFSGERNEKIIRSFEPELILRDSIRVI